MVLAQEFSHAGQARIIVAGVEPGDTQGFGVPAHGTELENVERATSQPDALLGIYNGSAVLDEDGQRADENQRQENNQQDPGQDDVETSLGEALESAELTVGGDAPASATAVGAGIAAVSLREKDAVNPAQAPLQGVQGVVVGNVIDQEPADDLLVHLRLAGQQAEDVVAAALLGAFRKECGGLVRPEYQRIGPEGQFLHLHGFLPHAGERRVIKEDQHGGEEGVGDDGQHDMGRLPESAQLREHQDGDTDILDQQGQEEPVGREVVSAHSYLADGARNQQAQQGGNEGASYIIKEVEGERVDRLGQPADHQEGKKRPETRK